MFGQGSVSEMVQTLKEIVNRSDSEIYMMLVECNMDPNETVMRLISQDTFHEVKSKRDKKTDTKDLAGPSRRRIPNHGARNSETRLAQSVPANNHWAGSSSAPDVLGRRPVPNSDPKNAEVKKAEPAGSTGAATSPSLPAPAYQSAWVKANPGKKTMAEIVKMGKQPLHQKKVIVPTSSETQESGNKAPLKDEGSSLEKQEVTDPVSSLLKPSAESKAQVSEPQRVDESQMDDEVPKKKTNPVVFHPDVDQAVQCSHLRFGSFGLEIGSGQASSRFNDILQDTQETEEGEERKANAIDEQTSYQINSTANRRGNHWAGSSSAPGILGPRPPPNSYQWVKKEAPMGSTGAATSSSLPAPASTARNNHASSDSEREVNLGDASISPPGAGQQAASLYQHPALNAYNHQHGMPLGNHSNFISYPYMPQGYMHSGFHVGNHQAPLVVIVPPSAPSLQQQNENTTTWQQIQRPNLHVVPTGGVYFFNVHPYQQPPGFVQPQKLHQQQLSQQAAMSLDQLHPHHQHHHQQSARESSSQTQERQWHYNN